MSDYRYLTKKTVVTRKPHRLECCGRRSIVGSKAVYCAAMTPSGFRSAYFCAEGEEEEMRLTKTQKAAFDATCTVTHQRGPDEVVPCLSIDKARSILIHSGARILLGQMSRVNPKLTKMRALDILLEWVAREEARGRTTLTVQASKEIVREFLD